jgi:Cytochrome C and Quinol oxidase polypeptide I
MLFALAFIVTFVNGGLTGLFLGNVVVDVPLSDTMFVVAHFHMVMGIAPIMGSSEFNPIGLSEPILRASEVPSRPSFPGSR